MQIAGPHHRPVGFEAWGLESAFPKALLRTSPPFTGEKTEAQDS